MKARTTMLLFCLWLLAGMPVVAQGETTAAERRQFNATIVDYSKHQNPKFKKVPRTTTNFIVVHTAEAGHDNTLQVVSDGKHLSGGRRTYGGHAHYVIGREGKTYRMLDKRYRADHAGKSMWNKQTNLSDVSIGIELVGYHHSKITEAQYKSLEALIDILQGIYKLTDRAVLTHSQVAYGGPNPWFRRNHRGRKHCAQNFDRRAAGLTGSWTYDPDVRAGRLLPDRELAAILYESKPALPKSDTQVITASRSAWMIAGEQYNDASTSYHLPSGAVVAGNRMKSEIGWSRVPPGTKVTVAGTSASTQSGSSSDDNNKSNEPQVLGGGNTPWSLAGKEYQNKSTYYLFPNGTIMNGQQISDWAGIPNHTQVFVGYQGPYRVTSSRPPIVIAGRLYRDSETLYLFPDRRVLTGSEITDWKRLPRGVRILLPAGKS